MENRIAKQLELQRRSPGLRDRGEATDDFRQPSEIAQPWMDAAAERIRQSPGISLGLALAGGIALGWWLKRH